MGRRRNPVYSWKPEKLFTYDEGAAARLATAMIRVAVTDAYFGDVSGQRWLTGPGGRQACEWAGFDQSYLVDRIEQIYLNGSD